MRFIATVVLALVVAFTFSGCSSGDGIEITKRQVCGGEVIWQEGTNLDSVANTGLCRAEVYLHATSSEIGFTKSYYVQVHNAPLTAMLFDSAVDPTTLTDFAPLKRPLFKDSLNSVVRAINTYKEGSGAIITDVLSPVVYDSKDRTLTLSGFTSAQSSTISVEYFHSESATYNLSYMVPRQDTLEEGYSLPPPDCATWVTVPASVTVPAFSTKTAPVTFTLPPDVITSPTKFEFWIVVREAEATEGVMMVGGVLKGVSQKTQFIQQWLVSLE
jgi:hypothetical protein